MNRLSKPLVPTKVTLRVIGVERLIFYLLFLAFAVPLSLEVKIGQVSFPIYVLDGPLLGLLGIWYGQVCMGKSSVKWSGVDLLFVLLVFWLGLASLAGLNPPASLGGFSIWIRAYLIYTYFYNRIGKQIKRAGFVRALVLLLLIQIPVAFAQFVTQSPIGALNQYFGELGVKSSGTLTTEGWIKRVQGTFFNPKILAGWLVMLLPFQLTKVFHRVRPRLRAFSLLLIIAGIATLVLTFSRAEIGALIIGGVLMFLLSNAKEKRRLLRFSIVVIGLGALFLMLSDTPISSTIAFRFDAEQLLDMKRVAYMRASIPIIFEHSVLGVGYDNFVLAMDQSHFGFEIKSLAGVHNIPLLLSAESGIPAGILFTILIICLITKLWRKFSYVDTSIRSFVLACLVAVSALSLTSLFNVIFLNPAVLMLFFSIAGAGLGIRNPLKKKEEEEPGYNARQAI